MFFYKLKWRYFKFNSKVGLQKSLVYSFLVSAFILQEQTFKAPELEQIFNLNHRKFVAKNAIVGH